VENTFDKFYCALSQIPSCYSEDRRVLANLLTGLSSGECRPVLGVQLPVDHSDCLLELCQSGNAATLGVRFETITANFGRLFAAPIGESREKPGAGKPGVSPRYN
jgi:hypothetical protein